MPWPKQLVEVNAKPSLIQVSEARRARETLMSGVVCAVLEKKNGLCVFFEDSRS